jgi:mRNA interferase MazF
MSARDVAWGDIRMVDLSTPDKPRPALVLTRTTVLPFVNAVTVAPITRTLRGTPAELAVGVAEGLKVPCAVNLDGIQTVSKARLGRWLGALSPARAPELREALLFAFALLH